MSRLLAIDPGNIESGWCIIDSETREPLVVDKWRNEELRAYLWDSTAEMFDRAVIEMVASYGMRVGAEVFETCVWVGRFAEAADGIVDRPRSVELVYRRDIKLHHCEDSRAKDSNVTQALVDRFAPGQRNYGKGTKDNPGWFYGFRKDMWQAYALAVYAADKMELSDI